ncbi:hypothetical protein EV426DRAFT_680524 [Tirmania nivea]|nr:hypothetical protein EV426DRAFT_680524 [Tirmania nivea]
MSTTATVKLSLPLAYQQDIFREIREEDGLVIMARGLGLPRIVTNLLHAYDAAGDNLVLIIGAGERENKWIGDSLVEQAVISKGTKARGLFIVNTDAMNVGARKKLYGRGGIFSVTSRILVVDMLTNLINPETITGLVVLHAERVIATSLEAFIIRIFRQKNKDGFIKAFSDSPEPFTTGFSPLATMMRNLFVRRNMLWPRFDITVSKSLEAKKPEVVELEVGMTESMREIQIAILECIEASISELRRTNSQHLELEDWTVDSALHKDFDIIIRRQLDPVWHRVSYKTRQIVSDLTQFRELLHSLLSEDCVHFNRGLENILATNTPKPGTTRQTQSPWLFLDAAHTIFTVAKRRIYTGDIGIGKEDVANGIPAGLVPRLEEQPKWAVLTEVLQEIERDLYANAVPMDTSNGVTLIMCSDEATCRQLREYIQHMNERVPKEKYDNDEEESQDEGKASATIMLRRKLRSYLNWKRESKKAFATLFSEQDQQPDPAGKRGLEYHRGRAPPNKRRRVRGGASAVAGPSRASGGAIVIPDDDSSHVAQLATSIQPNELEKGVKQEIVDDPMENMEDYYELFDLKDLVVIHPYDGDNDEHLLEELRPRFVIMYDPDAAFVRRVEVYRSSHNERNIRVYFMSYCDSVEERRYLSAVRKEKDAFTKLIREKSTMAVTLTTDGHGITDPQEQFLRTVNTRIAGGGRLIATADPPRVLVDVREFRSSLPSLIHGRNMVIVPLMLTVGDYILTPDICVERKSIKDLISSFKDGRLYNQCEVMFNHYKYPMLLIEFDQNKSFNLEPFADMSAGSTINNSDLQSKLVLLTIAFPKLRIIWSSSPYQTAEIFEELKKNLDEPDPVKAIQAGLEEGEDAMNIYNQTPQDMLRAVPGITVRNYKNIMVELENMMELANLEEAEINKIVGKESGRQVHRFFNRNIYE